MSDDTSMAVHERSERLNAAKLYRLATKLHTLLPYYFARNGHAFPVWHYFFEVTRRCNLRCVMCQYVEWLKNTPADAQKEGELTTDEWRRVIDQTHRLGVITFTGGEPFVRADFLELLEHGSARARTHFITNATMLTEERARRCAELAPKRVGGRGLNFVGVSIDGPRELHDQIRVMPGAFEKSARGVRMLRSFAQDAGKQCPMVHVTTVIQARNVDRLAEMPQVVADAGANVLNLTLEIRYTELPGLGENDPAGYRASDVDLPRIEPQRLERALKATRAAAAKVGVELRMPDMPDDEIVRYYDGQMRLAGFRCGSLWTHVIVGCQGGVYACWLKRVGSVREQSLKEIWNGPEMRAFRRRTRKGLYAPCAGCCLLVHTK